MEAERDILVKVENVSKKFSKNLKRSLWYGIQDVWSEILGKGSKNKTLRKDEFWAVKDVSFELRRGECLGLIGHNGAGKSTLLKMLNGLIKPDEGKITMKGRIGALIELGAGFNPILTGRENVYINGQILGFTKKEIDEKYDSIVEFAELEEFMETPVQNYSSGMRVRLGFAVASQMEPDVLIIDEVLAVGDLDFRVKCYSFLESIKDSASIILVSHSMPSVSKLCHGTCLLKNGSVNHLGDLERGIELYMSSIKTSLNESSGNLEFKILNRESLINKKSISFRFQLKPTDIAPGVYTIAMVLYDQQLRPIGMTDSSFDLKELEITNRKETQKVSVEIPNFLTNGRFTLDLYFSRKNSNINGPGLAVSTIRNAYSFTISEKPITTNIGIQLPSVWNLNKQPVK